MITIPDSYEQSRERFRASLAVVRDLWPAARLANHALAIEPDVTIDWISVDARKKKEKLFILITGEHGIEGYVGSAMQQLFIAEYLLRLDPAETGILLIHAINPWGMKHRRRVNPNNVDLNRSFVRDLASLADFNPAYGPLDALLNPPRPLKNIFLEKLLFFDQAMHNLVRYGMLRIREAILMGQYCFPKGIYFGGQELQEETRTMMELYQKHIGGYVQVLHLDMHTGYGPRFQMTLVNSSHGKMKSEEAARRFGYPRVAAVNPEEFYTIQGDMVDWMYTLVHEEFPKKHLYAASFEFGTFGESLGAVIRSLRTMVFENRLHWYGGSAAARDWMRREFYEMYAPAEPAWFAKAQADTRQAFEGILKAEGYIQ